MWKKFETNQKEEILSYISPDLSMNFFIYGDIVGLGLDHPAIDVYGYGEEIQGIILTYFDSGCIYSQKGNWDRETVAQWILEKELKHITGPWEEIQKLAAFLSDFEAKKTHLAELKEEYFQPKKYLGEELSSKDFLELVDFTNSIEEFPTRPNRGEEVEKMEWDQKNGGLFFGYKEEGKWISSARTSADTPKGSMIIGVATDKNHRNRGLASGIVSQMCKVGFERGREFFLLFYHNPQAGKIYKSLGFQEVGLFGMLDYKEG
ncbi:GNAT family N-acetyltransferase [Peptoniphilus sp. KCTC 25270]|uniref:GNAT family N-acetyltransferase n=1 Tax=Peptoniphilus sp. KCTC 25270 TaxID=2897414 RepID=UPI001E4577A8|nr:GNAT family N-acetyltransferase [Peptoniphilus sp. KCTC 25270]MCD1147699.1 GNAT family N-acetyltransferase [Peptoniphilus sp. KCTC 25270]